jgi:hypothetical protein
VQREARGQHGGGGGGRGSCGGNAAVAVRRRRWQLCGSSFAAAQRRWRQVSLDFCGVGSGGGGGGGGGMVVAVAVAVEVCLACFGRLDSLSSVCLASVGFRPRSWPRSKMGEG